MPLTISGLGRDNYVYDSDDGQNYTISMRTVYASASGLTAGNTNPPLPKRSQPRHIWISYFNSPDLLRRKFPCSKAKVAVYEAAGGTATVNIDGVDWTVHGFTGEKRKK